MRVSGLRRIRDAVRESLGEQGFGVLTEIDVTATLKAKLDEDIEDYVLLLPCNVVVRADGDRTVVQALDPQTMVALTGLDALRPVADEAARRLDAALASLEKPVAER